jgi:Cu2+-exporting ATPase
MPFAEPAAVASATRERAGYGVEGEVNGDTWRLGRWLFVAELSASTHLAHEDDAIFLGNEHGLVAAFNVSQMLQIDARAAVEDFEALGLQTVIASGDREAAVLKVARRLGITHAQGRLDPQQKLALVRRLQSEGKHVLMIGDGVNDGPVLAAADVSCAMGHGSAIAHSAADMVLMHDSLGAMAQSVRTSRRMLSVIRQNLAWSLAYNFSAVPLAAMDVLPPWLAALGMSLSSLVVVLNARRLAHRPQSPGAAARAGHPTARLEKQALS